MPLFYLAGRVDGGNIHQDRAYNDIFAKDGYVFEILANDGYSVSVESSRTIFNRDLILASTLNGEPLPEEYFPLRLVGEGLEGKEMVGQVAQIILNPNEGVPMPSDEGTFIPLFVFLPVLTLILGMGLPVIGRIFGK